MLGGGEDFMHRSPSKRPPWRQRVQRPQAGCESLGRGCAEFLRAQYLKLAVVTGNKPHSTPHESSYNVRYSVEGEILSRQKKTDLFKSLNEMCASTRTCGDNAALWAAAKRFSERVIAHGHLAGTSSG